MKKLLALAVIFGLASYTLGFSCGDGSCSGGKDKKEPKKDNVLPVS